MNTEVTRAPNTTRRRVALFLAFLSMPDCQRTCARFIPVEKLTFELCRLWFNDIYAPGTRYIDGLKGDHSSAEEKKFWKAFTAEEQAAVERFHRFLELRLDMLPEEARASEIFPQNDLWISVTRDAGHTLEALNLDTEQLQRELTWIVRTVVLKQLENK